MKSPVEQLPRRPCAAGLTDSRASRASRATRGDARAARALCFDDVRAERAPLVCGVHGGLGDALGVHVAHFRPMCLTARNSLRHPTGPITSRTGPTRFDVRS